MPPTDKPSRHFPAGRLLAEGALIVFAVLVALAVDEWWMERENALLAERAVAAVASELRSNRAELTPDLPASDLSAMLADLGTAIELYERGETPRDLGVTWNVGLLSSAAWETAQITQATQYMPIEQVIDVAKVYEFQQFYAIRQDEVVALISDLEGQIDADPVPALMIFRGRYRVAYTLRETLDGIYACALRDLGMATPKEAADCNAAEDAD